MHRLKIPSLRSRSIPVLLVCTFAFVLANTLALTLLPAIEGLHGSGPQSTGTTIAVSGIAAVIASWPAAAAAVHWGPRAPLALSFVAVAVSAVAIFRGSPLAATAAMGTANALFWPASLAALTDLAPMARRGPAHGWGALAQGLAGLLAIALLGLETTGPSTVHLAIAALGAAAIGFVASVTLPPRRSTAPTTFRACLRVVLRDTIRLAKHPATAGAAIASVSWSILWWVVGPFLLLFYVSSLGTSVAMASSILALRAAAATGVRFGFGRAVAAVGPLRLLVGSTALAGVAVAIPVAAPLIWVAIAAACLQGVGLGLMQPSANLLVGTVADSDGLHAAFVLPLLVSQATLATTPLLLGGVAEATGPGAALLVGVAGAFAAIAVTWLGARQGAARARPASV